MNLFFTGDPPPKKKSRVQIQLANLFLKLGTGWRRFILWLALSMSNFEMVNTYWII